MIYLSLFWSFLQIGLFSFGGGYASIPLIQDVVLRNGWMDETMFSTVIAISESTPGPLMVNAATYIGSRQGGILGAAIATFAVVLPAFLLIVLITALFSSFLKNKKVQAILCGIKPCIMGIILATGLYMACTAIIGTIDQISLDWIALLIFALLAGIALIYKKVKKEEFSPILLIVIAAALGMILYH